ncbi:Epoxyqueuosine (oQ) reductase QueG [invertebrate metagenome]|uniref:Epoxyqueuosine (OQ) reductase QueG n=1 Tax=invertebrate metagenome TaxID=1711999 RepID=A0A484H5Z1_9ZZZZ
MKASTPVGDIIRAQAYALGFDSVGFTHALLPEQIRTNLAVFLAECRHGDMRWMANECRNDPCRLWPAAVSVVVLGLNYAPAGDPMAFLGYPRHGLISSHARNRDYHSVIRTKLQALGQWMYATFNTEVKVFVDTAPLLEKPLAQMAGLGWQGRHTNLVSRRFGSWLFLGEILTSLALPPDQPHPAYCGTCHRCQDVCPTGALTASGQIDARRCISYLTIEHKGSIPAVLRPLLGNRIYGCDDCLAVCPWNRFAPPTATTDLQPHFSEKCLDLAILAGINTTSFTDHFRGSSLHRIGRDRLVRNVLIAIGNSGIETMIPVALARLQDSSPLVRGAAVWALSRLLSREQFTTLRTQHLPEEQDVTVQTEWTQGEMYRGKTSQ